MSWPTYAELTTFLEQHGFSKTVIPESHVLFENLEADARIMLRLHQDSETVEPHNLVYVRHTLDAWGILDRDEFDAVMGERTRAG